MPEVSARTDRALELFAPLGPTYERYARVLSLDQDPRWRRFLVSRVDAGPGDRVLDVATGTGAVAAELLRQKGCVVVGVDQSTEMLAVAREHVPTVELVEASAERLPFADGSFDGLTFTYLLRYVDDPGATLQELARVVRSGGTIASLEFGVPAGVWHPLWRLYVGAVLPGAGRLVSPAWHEVGRFLGSSIREFWRRYPLDRQLELWRAAGIEQVSHRRLSLGGDRDLGPAGVSTEARPAFYALAPGGWRDYVTLLHPPYTAWHLSYVVIGACLAPHVPAWRLALTVLAFFLGLGIGAHALDELNGRPLQTRIPVPVLIGLAAGSLAGAAAIGIVVALQVDLWLLPFIAFGVFVACAYNLELFGGRFHGSFWLATGWGAFPVLTAYLAASGEIRGEAVLAAVFAALLIRAQQILSTPVRDVRRRTVSVTGVIERTDGTRVPIGPETLTAANELALKFIAGGCVALAAAFLLLRFA